MIKNNTLSHKNDKRKFTFADNKIIDEIKIKKVEFDRLQQAIEILIKSKNIESHIDNIFKIENYHVPIKLNDWYCPRCANRITKMGVTEIGIEKTCAKCGYKVILKRLSRRKCYIEAIAPE